MGAGPSVQDYKGVGLVRMMMMDETRILLWQGCTYRNQLPEELSSVHRVLSSLDVDFETLTEEGCCTFPLIMTGYIDQARKASRTVLEQLNDFELVVTPCPACYRAFRQLYGEKLGLQPSSKFLHLSQFLAQLQSAGRLKFSANPLSMKVIYHDPCELGRHSEVYEEPRRILSAIPGVSLVEQKYTKEEAVCCGGNALPLFTPILASKVAARKLMQEDEISPDLDAVVTCCPSCVLNLRKGLDLWIKRSDLREIKVLSLARVLEGALAR